MNAVIDNESGEIIPEETQKHIAELNQVESGLAALKAEHDGKEIPDCSTAEGYKQAKALRKSVADVRIKTEKSRKAAKDYFLNGGRRIDAMSKSILEVTDPIEERYQSAIKAADDELARIESEKVAKEQARIESHETTMAEIKSFASAATLDGIRESIDAIELIINNHNFQEFKSIADGLIEDSLTALNARKLELEAHAIEAKRLEEEKAKQEAEAQRLQQERNAIEAERRKEADKLEAERNAIEEEKRKLEAEKLAEREKQEAAERAKQEEQMRLEAEKQKAIDAEKERSRRLAAAPDAIKLRKWFNSMDEITMPKTTTDEGTFIANAIADEFRMFMSNIDPLIADIETKEEAA